MPRIPLTNHAVQNSERQRACAALAMMKEIERKRKLVSVRLDDKTVIATTKDKIKYLMERHGVRDKLDAGKVVVK